MINKLLLSTLAIVSTINLANAQTNPKEITYPINVGTAGKLLLTKVEDGYKFTAQSTVGSDDPNAPLVDATLIADKDVTYDNTFSATGAAKLTYTNVIFNKGLTLKAGTNNTGNNPVMTVSGNMKIAGSGTIDTGNSTIEFTGSNSQLDISEAAGVTFTKLSASGTNENKLTINYGEKDTVRTKQEDTKTLLEKLSGKNFTNTEIHNIFVSKGKESVHTTGEEIVIEENKISVVSVDRTVDATDGKRLIEDDLLTSLKNAGITINNVETNDMGNEPGGEYTVLVDFGIHMNTAKDSITPNSSNNTLVSWNDKEYDLDSRSDSNNEQYTFNMAIQPAAAKTLSLKSANQKLNKIVFKGKGNGNLTVSLKSANLKNIEFDPEIETSIKIDASATNNDLKLLITGSSNAKSLNITSVPSMASGKVYSLNMGANTNAILWAGSTTTFDFSAIEGNSTNSIYVGGNAILKL